MNERLFPDRQVPGAFWVRFGSTQQSFVDPADPELLMFEYVQHIAIVLESSVLRAAAGQRLRVVHIGGAGMTIPRWVAWRRPQTAQVVCEPDVELTAEVRRKIPLPPRSGIKVRDVDGRAGLAAMPDAWADAIIVDAFAGSQVPGELATAEALDEMVRVLRGDALLVLNVTDRAPFSWVKGLVAGVARRLPHVLVGAEPIVHKGKRFGNLLVVGAHSRPDERAVERESGRLPVGYRWLTGRQVAAWCGNAEPRTDADALDSPSPGFTW